MTKSSCPICGGAYHWRWEEAFDKFGFGDGDGDVRTSDVVHVLEDAGYEVASQCWGLHNEVIGSIFLQGREQIPASADVGYDDPRVYLPAALVALLDEKLGSQIDKNGSVGDNPACEVNANDDV